MFIDNFEIIVECIKADPNTYEYATSHLKIKNIDPVVLFLKRGGSFALICEHLRKNKKVVMVAVKNNPINFQYLGKILKDGDEIFKLAFQQDKELLRYASERLGKKDSIL